MSGAASFALSANLCFARERKTTSSPGSGPQRLDESA